VAAVDEAQEFAAAWGVQAVLDQVAEGQGRDLAALVVKADVEPPRPRPAGWRTDARS
jgi:hypothetical protein